MKRLAVAAILLAMLSGCAETQEGLDRAMGLRAKLLGSGGCQFDAVITADYGDELCEFSVSCQGDSQGNVTFTVKEPETIAGITGAISAEGGKLTFDGKALAFPLLADEQVTPVSGPWIFLRTLQGGNVRSCGMDGDLLRVSIDDSYEDDALRLDIWLDSGDLPVRGEILYRERRIVTIQVKNFVIL